MPAHGGEHVVEQLPGRPAGYPDQLADKPVPAEQPAVVVPCLDEAVGVDEQDVARAEAQPPGAPVDSSGSTSPSPARVFSSARSSRSPRARRGSSEASRAANSPASGRDAGSPPPWSAVSGAPRRAPTRRGATADQPDRSTSASGCPALA